jgi:hypothetical protein
VYVEKEQYEGHRIVVLHYLLALEKPCPSVEVAPPSSMRPADPIGSGSVGGAPAAVGARPSTLVGNKSAEDKSESEQQQQVGQTSSSATTRAKGVGDGKGGCGKRKRGTKADQSRSEEFGGGDVADGDIAGDAADVGVGVGDGGGENEEEEVEGEEDEVCEAAVSVAIALPSSVIASATSSSSSFSSSVSGSSKGPVVVSVSEGPAAGVVTNSDQVGTSLDLASASSDDDALAALNRCKNYILTVVLKTDD